MHRVVDVAANLAAVRARIERAGGDPDAVAIVAVTKGQPAEACRAAVAAGLTVLGENRVQEALDKMDEVPGAKWHLIGHLQTNKAARAAELFSAVDSLDSVRLAEKLNTAAEKLGKTISSLIEINVGGEEAKSGVATDSPELEAILSGARQWKHLSIRGLMTIPPFTDDPAGARPFFRQLRELRDRIAARQLPDITMDVLSMGMSHDFEVAIEEGSTCLRVGTAIFGERTKLE